MPSEPTSMRWLSRVVTVGVVIVVLGLIALWVRSRVPDSSIGGGFETHALFRDGSRLQPGSPVVIAGVRIGDVTNISIVGSFARVDMRLRDDVQLPPDTFVTRRADSLFGDSYVEIIPGRADEPGAARLLRSGEAIPHVIEGSSTDSVLRAIGTALPRIDNALDGVHEFMVNSRQWVQGPMAGALTDADQWLQEGHIESPLASANRAMERLERGTTAAAEAVHATAPDVRRRLRAFDDSITNVRKDMADAQVRLTTVLADARAGMDGIDPVLSQMAEVITAIDRGEGDEWQGTLGRLVNDPGTANTLEDGTQSLADATASFNQFKSWLGARVEFGAFSRSFRFYATAEVRARNDKFYLVELSKSELGGFPADSLSDAAGADAYTRRQEIRDELRFTFQFGKRFDILQLRGGIKDSTFGFGGDVLLAGGKLRFSTDVFGSFQRTPRLKVAAALAVFRSLYVIAGVDDALNDPGYLSILDGNTEVPSDLEKVRYGRDYFAGAMLQFNDVDLATLLRVYGALLIGLL